MSKRIISLLLAVLLFASLGVCAFAEKETVTIPVGPKTMKMICEEQGLDYEFCKAAIIQLNPDKFTKEDDFKNMMATWTIKLPKTNQAAAEILGKELPANLLPKTTGETQTYTIKTGDTMISICKDKGLTFEKCKAAIMKLNGWTDYNFLNMKAGTTIKLPKSDADAPALAAATGTATGITATTLWGTDAVAAYMVPYIVKAGETIYGICQANGVDFNRYVDLIMKASGITYATNLRAGDVIFLPSGSSASGSMSVVAHTVLGGETVYGICQTLGIDYNSRYNLIVALNPTKNLNSIHTGEVIYFPAGGTGTTTTAGGTVTGTGTGTSAGGAGAYTPAAADPAVTQKTPKAEEKVMFGLREYTVKADDTVYNILKNEGMDMQYFNYYVNAMMAADGRATYSTLKAGDKILIATKATAGLTMSIQGFKVKTGDMTEALCNAKGNGIKYSDAGIPNLIVKLNPSLNVNNLHVDDIILLPVKP